MNTGTRLILWLAGWIVGLLVVTLIGLMFAVHQSKDSLAKYRSELIQRGEQLDVSALTPPKAPTTGNGAPALVAEGKELAQIIKSTNAKRVTLGQKESYGRAEVMHQRAAALRDAVDVPWAEVEATLAPMQEPLAAIRQASAEPILALDLDYSRGFSMPLEHLTPLLSTAQYLSMDALMRLQKGDIAGAVDNIEAELRLSRLVHDQPLLICQLVSFSVISLAEISTWETLQAKATTAADLARLQSAWEAVLPSQPMARTLRLERAVAGPMFEEGAEMFRTVAGSGSSSGSSSGMPATPTFAEIKDNIAFAAWGVFFRYADERQLMENYQTLLDDLSPDQPQNWTKILATMARIEKSQASAGMGRFFSASVIPSLKSTVERFATTETLRNLTITAIVLRRYQLDHAGALPAKLDALVPQYLAIVPRDPLNGESLRYRLTDDGFALYSVGLDGSDDGGNANASPKRKSRSILDRLDIVWPQPPSPEKKPAGP